MARRSFIRLLIFIPLTWILFSLMYSFNGRTSSFRYLGPLGGGNEDTAAAAVTLNAKFDKIRVIPNEHDNEIDNGDDSDVNQPKRPNGGKHKHHKLNEVFILLLSFY